MVGSRAILSWVNFQRPVLAASLVLTAGAAGLALAGLPLIWAALGLLITALLVAAVIEPLVGIAVTLLFATFKPLTDYFVPQFPLDIGQLALIATLAICGVRQAIRHDIRIPASPFNLPLLAFIGVAALSLASALSLGYGLKELIKWLQILIMMWLIQLQAGQRRWPIVVGVVLAAGLLQAAIGIWQFGLRGDGPETFLILNDRFYRAYGTFEQPNPYGGFIGLILPLALALAIYALLSSLKVFTHNRATDNLAAHTPERRSAWPFVRAAGFGLIALLLTAALVASWSRGAWLGAGAAVLIVLAAWPRRGWLGIGLLTVALALGFVTYRAGVLPASVASRLTDFTSEISFGFDVRGVDITTENYAVIERFAHWQVAQDMARYHPLLGVGLGNYEPVYPGFELINWPYPLGHAHNIYLNMLAETGIIGLLAYVSLWVMVFVVTWQVTRHSSGWQRAVAIGLLGVWVHLSVHQLVDNLYVANIHLHLGALLSVLSVLYHDRRVQSVER